MHVLVTGGTGFVGTAFCESRLAAGDRVSVWTRSRRIARQRLPPAIHFVEALPELEDQAVDAIVNLAGENLAAARWRPAHLRRCLESRLQVTAQLVDWMRRSVRPPALISGSAIGWYGARDDSELTESSASGGDDEFTVRLCKAWEAEAMAAERIGARVCCVRIGIVLERDGGSLARMLPPFRLGLGGPIGNGRQWMSWIHRDDLVSLLGWLVDRPSARGIYNGTAPRPVRNLDFARTLGAALGRPARVPMPAFVLRTLVGDMADLLLTGQRVIPGRAMSEGFHFKHATLSSALTAIVREGSA